MTTAVSLSNYPVRCIIPSDRFWIVTDKVPVEIEKPSEDLCADAISYYDSNGTKTKLLCNEIGSMFCFEYIQRIVFLHEREFRECIYQTVENRDHEWCMRMKDKVLQNETRSDISLRYIGVMNGIDVGHGVFSELYIPAGSYIGEYVGLVSSINETTVREDHYNFQYPCCDGGLEINGREYGNLMRFINHSVEPNAEFRAVNVDDVMHVVCVLAVDLPPDTQITVDYGGAFWMRQKIEPTHLK